MHQIDPAMKACMDACHDCHVTCLHMAMNHCLEMCGQHAAPRAHEDHGRLRADLRGHDRLHGSESPPTTSISAASAPRSAVRALRAARLSKDWKIAWRRVASAPTLATGWRPKRGLRARLGRPCNDAEQFARKLCQQLDHRSPRSRTPPGTRRARSVWGTRLSDCWLIEVAA